jgi:hypothetical protein
MKTINRTIIAFFAAGIASVVVFYASILAYRFGAERQVAPFAESQFVVTSVLFWAILSVTMGLPIAFGHIVFLGVPAFILGWHFRAIRWWSTLGIAFIIGAVPTGVYLYLGPPYLFESNRELIFIMGLFGISGGLVFWLLWRYWVGSSSPFGRTIPLAKTRENESSEPNPNSV